MKNKIKCPYCNEYFKVITYNHLKNHNKTIAEVRKEFPELKVTWNDNETSFTDKRVKNNGEKARRTRVKRNNYYAWNKGETKETNESVKGIAEKQSKTRKKMFSNGEIIIWNKGLTAETDERVKDNRDKWLKAMWENQEQYKFGKKYTKLEESLYNELKRNKLKYKPQKPLSMEGLRTLVDAFVFPNICVYIDGDYWHANPQIYKANDIIKYPRSRAIKAKDRWKQDKYYNKVLRKNGFIVIRIPELGWYKNPKKFIDKIIKKIPKKD